MPRELADYLPREMALLGLIECALSFVVIYVVIGAGGVSGTFPSVFLVLRGSSIASAALLTAITGTLAVTIGLFRPDLCFGRKRQLAAFAVIACTALLVGAAVSIGGPAVIRPFYMFAWVGAMTLIRLGYSFAIIKMPVSRRIVILGDDQQAAGFCSRLRSRRGRAFDLVDMPEQQLSWPFLQAQRIWAVVLTSAPDTSVIDPLLACKFRGVRILGAGAFHENYLGRIDLNTVTANDLLFGSGFSSSGLSNLVKRSFDVAIASGMLISLLPLMALTALAIKIDSPGPVFYCQRRAGRFDKPFLLFKFRSMSVDAEAGGSPRWAQTQDPRVTRVGRFIRAARIDELPQLANVLGGQMSLVGPRPERPHFVEQLERAIPFYQHRAVVKPGLTGWAQVNFPYGASVEDAREKLSYDLYYVKNRSLLLDLAILLSTVRVVLFREGAR